MRVEWQIYRVAMFVTRLLQKDVYFPTKPSGSALSVLLHSTLKEVLVKYTSLKFNTFIG